MPKRKISNIHTFSVRSLPIFFLLFAYVIKNFKRLVSSKLHLSVTEYIIMKASARRRSASSKCSCSYKKIKLIFDDHVACKSLYKGKCTSGSPDPSIIS